MDRHADTCIVGKHALIVHLLEKKVNVTGFYPIQGQITNLDLISAAVTYNCPRTGEIIIHDKPGHPHPHDGE
jgi:hypothetical protein